MNIRNKQNTYGTKEYGKRMWAVLLLLFSVAVNVLFADNMSVRAAEAPQPQALFLFAWNGIGEDGELMKLDLGVNGTLNDGREVFISEQGIVVTTDGTPVGAIAAADGQLLLSLYRTDGTFRLDLMNGEDWANYGINNISQSGAAALVLLPGQELQSIALTEDMMYRSYTGIWFYGIGLDQGTLTSYSQN